MIRFIITLNVRRHCAHHIQFCLCVYIIKTKKRIQLKCRHTDTLDFRVFFVSLPSLASVSCLKKKRKMTSDLIVNKADFQRHLNGCERRLNDLTKTIENTEKLSQKLLLNSTLNDQRKNYFQQLDFIQSEIKYLSSSLVTLNQSSFSSTGKKRLDLFQQNLEKHRNKFQQIQQYAQNKFHYEYQIEEDEEEQQQLLIQKKIDDQEIELDLIHQHTIKVNQVEQDLNELHGTFVDLNRLIHEQGTIVDNIEQALTTTDELVHEAVEHVKTTVVLKKRTNRLKWILIVFFICLILLLIIIIYITLKLAVPHV